MTGKKFAIFAFLSLLLFSFSTVTAQENPPTPIEVEVRTSRYLSFGSFTSGSNGGNVFINSDGTRTVEGDIYLLNIGATPSSALFDIYANPGTIIHIQKPQEIVLTNSNSGRIYLRDFNFSSGQTFITTAAPGLPNEVFVGGTLRVPNAGEATPGSYNGSFTLTFIHQ